MISLCSLQIYFPRCKCIAKALKMEPPSGLYGPWVSSDNPAWNGDYTLDCEYAAAVSTAHPKLPHKSWCADNQESQFEHVYASGHP